MVLRLSALDERRQQPECRVSAGMGLLPQANYATACFNARLVVAYSSSGVNGFAM